MSEKLGDNHSRKLPASDDKGCTDWAFLRLADVLAEIADDMERKQAESARNTSGNKGHITERLPTLDGGCKNGNERNL